MLLPVGDTVKLDSNLISIQRCAEACVENAACFGFTYHARTAQCDLLMEISADLEEAETESTERLQYFIHRVQRNVAKGELLLTLYGAYPCPALIHSTNIITCNQGGRNSTTN